LIARIWRGAVHKHDGDAYAEYMQGTGIAGYMKAPGNRGVWMLRRDLGEKTEFVMFTLWDSLDAVKAFAGEDYESAVFYPEDDRFLVERDPTSSHYLVDTHVSPLASEADPEPAHVVRDHIVAFNARDLDRLLACFSADATWITGTDRFRGKAQLAKLFGSAFSELSPELTITSMLADRNHVACELSEQLVVGGVARVDHIAGFYEVDSGRITRAKIYREGSADADER
jgi:limonene-1,2-epoxide hydrolase/heme-degrading monooxygenase HmoA